MDTHDNGRKELPWDFRDKRNEFVTISQKPKKLTKEQFERTMDALNTINLVPRQLTLEALLTIPKKDSRIDEMLHGLRNRKFLYHSTEASTPRNWQPDDFKVVKWPG